MSTHRVSDFVFAWVLFPALLIAGGCASSAPQASESRQQVITACTDLVLDYALYRDQLDAEKTARLFTSDATLSVLGQTFVGREAIRDRISANQNGPKTRHMMSTIRIRPEGSDRATGISYVAVYAARGDEGEVHRVDGFAILGNYVDEFERTDDGWKIASRRLEGAFQSADLP